jgi:hypothetical protein
MSAIARLYRFDTGSFHAKIFRLDGVFGHLAMPQFTYTGRASCGDLVQTALPGTAMNHHDVMTAQAFQHAGEETDELRVKYAQQLVFCTGGIG